MKPPSLPFSTPKVSEYLCTPWIVSITEHHILKSSGSERETFECALPLPGLPEMIFDKNSVSIMYNGNSTATESRPYLSFTALDALKMVDCTKITVEVPFAKEWQKARENTDEQLDQPKPYDWTFTTPYNGSLRGPWSVDNYAEGLDMSLLRRRDPILFYAETTLFEDELGDNGISMLNIKLRVMETGFFLLQRFFLRVDGGLVRTFDTRIQWRKGDKI
ncbi:unnamed protein product [Dicrocoelium dendriticum]|nr:unnamed protein product [Dicrocoelium dendriticum]